MKPFRPQLQGNGGGGKAEEQLPRARSVPGAQPALRVRRTAGQGSLLSKLSSPISASAAASSWKPPLHLWVKIELSLPGR